MADAVLSGRKTATRRFSGRCRVGNRYAVQRGRGKRGEGFIEILTKSRQRLGEITTTDAVLEGFDSRERFLDYWASLHGGVELERIVWAYTFRVVGVGE